MKSIAVLMTCYNRVQTTLACLERLRAQELPDGYALEVWLVDDASPDQTGEKVRAKYENSSLHVHVIPGTGSLFWCKGMRLAWDKAAEAKDYDAYLWLNDDVMLNPGAVATLIADAVSLGSDETVVISGTMSSDSSGGKLCYGCYGGGVLRPNGTPQKADDYEMSGNLVYVPRAAFLVLGPIYGGYSHAYGDSDYRQTMRKRGVLLYCSSVVSGVCPEQPERYMKLAQLSVVGRIAALFSPKGVPVRDVFVYRLRHWGFCRALVSSIHVVTNAIFFPKRILQ